MPSLPLPAASADCRSTWEAFSRTRAVSPSPPEGFVSDYDELSEAVNNDLQAVQFTITELGSDLVPTQTTFHVQHDGNWNTIHSNVGIQLTPEYAQSRGFNVAELRAQGLIRERPRRGRR